MLNVLVGCEFSGIVRDAFRALGFNAWSCDLLRCEADPRWHIQGDVRDAIRGVTNPRSGSIQTHDLYLPRSWDLIILHVDCTKMAVCGNRTYGAGKARHGERAAAIGWTLGTVDCALSNASFVALENPASVVFPILRRDRGADVQYIHPWQHGHPEQKKTGLALWGLPRIVETANVHEEMMALPRKERERIFFMSPSEDRGHERSRFYPGFAAAMAGQWGRFIRNHRREAA